MKKSILMLVLVCALLLTGCGRTENPYQVDTVVRIPVDPTDAPTAAPTEAEETAAPTETQVPEVVTEPTEATEEKAENSVKKPTSAKNPTSGKKPESSPKPADTEPLATEPATQPPTEAAETIAPTEPPYDPSDYSVGSLERAVLDEMNAYRAEAGLGELSISKKLSGIAALRAEEALEIWSHTRPDGRNYSTAMSDYGYGFGASAENLAHASGSGDAAAMVSKWMDTDSKSNILNENFTTAGIGVSHSGGATIVAVLLVS